MQLKASRNREAERGRKEGWKERGKKEGRLVGNRDEEGKRKEGRRKEGRK